MTTYWHTGAHKCSAEEFVAFVAWASKQTKLDRNVVLICEPPAELFYDLSVPFAPGEMPDTVCGSTLMDEWPSLGIFDTRLVDQRPTPWWREDCMVRADWWKRYEAREVQP